MSVTVTPLRPLVGAEISGVDLRNELSAEDAAIIVKTWLDRGVILLRGQDIDEHQQVRFSRLFGELIERPRPKEFRKEKDDAYNGYTMLVSNIRDEKGEPIGSLPDGEMHFHSDMSYIPTPSRATILYSIEVPKEGGDTVIASTTAAYDALDEDTKKLLAGRNALQGFMHGTTLRERNSLDKSASHPAVRVIPETGRKSLFISHLMTFAIEGLPKDQSDALLERLFKHMERPEFVYAHKWRPGDVLIWDNRSTIHARTDFSRSERRLLRRFATQGEVPVAA
jgi:taurine dioxygenase